MAVEHTFTCALCGANAGRLTVLGPGEVLPDLADVAEFRPSPAILDLANREPARARLVQHTPWVEQTFDVTPRVLAGVAAGDASGLYEIEHEMVPFWCPECGASYCATHWKTWDVMDDLFFDERRGICPHGHERQIVD